MGNYSNFNNTKSTPIKWTYIVIQFILLLLIFIGPEIPFSLEFEFTTNRFYAPICCIAVYYINYYFLVNRYLFTKKRVLPFLGINIVLILAVVAITYYIFYTQSKPILPPPPPQNSGFPPPPIISTEEIMHIHFIRVMNIMPRIMILVLLAIVLSILVRFSRKWSILKRKEMQMKAQLQENELKNLKNQLNPHFLFNTLNNIYALISISQDKAQKSIHELSQLLRYILYENNETEVTLEKDLLFVKNYISLMQLRLNSLTTLKVDINEKCVSGKKIAPLLFISLIENAFKHGVSCSKESFVSISIHVNEDTVICRVANSYFPKKGNDKSGSGIGINNLQRQLDILYSDRYSLTKSIENNIYTTELIINFKNHQ